MSASGRRRRDADESAGGELIGRIRRAVTGDGRPAALEPLAHGWKKRLDQLESRAREEVSVLVALILGGTGVGKSTLINALVGRAVAASSRIRPCTQHFTLYGPARLDRSLLPLRDLPFVHVPAAPEEPLEHILLIDAPDCDSIEPENRRRLEQLLPLSDVLITVGTEAAGKYKIEALYELIRAFRDVKHFVFVYNQRDGEHEQDAARVVEDWRQSLEREGFVGPRIFRFNAHSVWQARRDGHETAKADAEFAELRNWLFARLSAGDVQLIKRGNIAGEVEHLMTEIVAAADEHGARIAAAQEYLDAASAELAHWWMNQVRQRVEMRWRSIFRRRIASVLAQESAGIFGAAARCSAFYAMVGLLPLHVLRLARGRWGAASAVAREGHRLWQRWRDGAGGELAEFEDLLPGMLRQSTEAQRVMAHYLRDAGLPADTPLDPIQHAQGEPGLISDFVRRWEGWMGEAIDRHRLWLCNVPVQTAFNAPPLALVGWATWTTVARFAQGDYVPLDYYLNVLFLLLLLLGAELWVFRGIASWGARGMLRRRLGRIESDLGATLFPSARGALERARRGIAALHDLGREVDERIARDMGGKMGPALRGTAIGAGRAEQRRDG